MTDHGPQKKPSSAAKINAETRQLRREILDAYPSPANAELMRGQTAESDLSPRKNALSVNSPSE